MHRDIRSFFTVKKVKKRVEDEDSDVIPESPEIIIVNKKKQSRKRRQIQEDSDEEIFSPPKKKHIAPKPALKEVKAVDIFGSAPIKRSEPIVKKTKKETETGIHSDEEFEKSLLQLDEVDNLMCPEPPNNENHVTKIDSIDKSKEKLGNHDSKDYTNSTNSDKKTNKSIAHKSNSDKTNLDTKAIQKNHDSKHSVNRKGKESTSHKIKIDKVDNDQTIIVDTEDHEFENSTNKKDKESSSHKKKLDKIENHGSKKELKHHDKDSTDKRDKESNSHKKKLYKVDNDQINMVTKSEQKNHESKDSNNKTDTKSSSHKRKLDKIDNDQTIIVVDTKSDNIKKDKVDFSDFLKDGEKDDNEHKSNEPKQKKVKLDKSFNESVLTDEERHERRRHSAALYKNYLNRSGPKHLGTKEIPEGRPDCLKNCAFLLTGVLDSFEREEVVATITKYGGCIKSGISRKVTHVLAGDEAGPAKLAKAEELGIKILNEDEFLKMIKDSTDKNKYKSKSNSKGIKKENDIEKKSAKRDKSIEKRNDSHKELNKNVKNEGVKIKESKLSLTNGNKERSVSPKTILLQEEVKSETKPEPIIINNDSHKSGMTKNLSLMWVDKYKPTSLKQIIGQHGEKSNVKKLSNWLTQWYVNRKTKIPKPSPWAKDDNGAYYKAALLSGPPGVGKTTTVSLVCKELGFDMVEFNASDTRSKTLIREQIGELLSTTSLSAYARGATGKGAVSKKHVLVMDEVDGMAGNEDRGGLQELISLIKSTSVPVICMCNDRNSEKMRSLLNYCYDLRFDRPRVNQIMCAMKSICFKENVTIPNDVLTQLIEAAGHDVRQTLHMLSVWVADSNLMDHDRLKGEAGKVKKDMKMGPWEAIRRVFSAEEHQKMSINDKSDLFFTDYSIMPLFVQENYLNVVPHGPGKASFSKRETLERLSRAADSISLGDLVDARIRRCQAWSLLPMQAMYSSVMPGHFMEGHVAGQIQFPGWLGKNSRATKMRRLAQEIHAHTRLSTSGSKSSIFLDYSTHLRDAILDPLIKDKTEGIDQSLRVLESYNLLREDLDSLVELSLWPERRNPIVLIDPKVKAALTRTYNKTASALPYAPAAFKKGRGIDDNSQENSQDDVEEVEQDSDPENDAMIKKKKNKETEKAGPSKASGKGKKNEEHPSSSTGKKSKTKMANRKR
ncbi:replication factor C subunit 1 [Maniola hyperantus]|uniref:replication factor C subunit 1 n=1 Tax=Aphantopus hyperantus TaxID=2795564 RepID=UPI001569E1F0|nr:replication factor C subunit 1 [Maniola hyperantus]